MKRPLLALISILVIIASGVSIYLSQRQPTPRVNLKPFEGIGLVGAEEVAKSLGGKGRIVVVAYDVKAAPVEVPVTSFLAELPKHGSITVTAVERLAMNPGDIPMHDMGLEGERFLELLKKHADVDAIVSFVGGPHFKDQDYRQVPAKRPKFLSLGGFSPFTRDQLELGVVNLAIVPRFDPPAAASREPQTPREWFDRFYTVVTPETAQSLPAF